MGGKQSNKVEIPQYLQDASKDAIGRANSIADLGYMPYYGPDVAAFSPQQMASFDGANAASSAFGMPTQAVNVPQPQTFAGGVQGYSSGGLYDQAIAELQRRNPGQYDALTSMFINPQTGAAPAGTTPTVQPTAPAPSTAPAGIPPRGRYQDANGNWQFGGFGRDR